MTDDVGRAEPPTAADKPPEVLTIKQAADRLQISITTAKKLAARGEFPGLLPKLGRQWRVSSKLLDQYLATPVGRR